MDPNKSVIKSVNFHSWLDKSLVEKKPQLLSITCVFRGPSSLLLLKWPSRCLLLQVTFRRPSEWVQCHVGEKTPRYWGVGYRTCSHMAICGYWSCFFICASHYGSGSQDPPSTLFL